MLESSKLMKITEIRTTISWAGLRNWVIVKILTDSEIYGWGEATLEGKEETVIAAIKQLGQSLIGEDPLASEHHWQTTYRHSFWRGGVVLNSALAGLDQALWDIRGKAWGVPVYKLLGGPTRKRIRLYTHVGIYQPQEMIADAQRDVADGFTAMKTGAWHGDSLLPEHERVAAFSERIASLRQAVGPKVDIMVDDHGRGRSMSAVRLLTALEPQRLLFFEEACQPDDIESLARLRAANLTTDLATGERLYSKWEYRPLLEQRLVDVIQPDLCHAGGITECKKIAALAETYYVNLAPTTRKALSPPPPPPTWPWRSPTFSSSNLYARNLIATRPCATPGLWSKAIFSSPTAPVLASNSTKRFCSPTPIARAPANRTPSPPTAAWSMCKDEGRESRPEPRRRRGGKREVLTLTRAGAESAEGKKSRCHTADA
jgi:galactonate dehydratase